MCVSIRASAQDLIISSVYQRAKTLSRSTVARFEVNLHNGSMFADQRVDFALNWARAHGLGVVLRALGPCQQHHYVLKAPREGCSFTVTYSGKWCPVSTYGCEDGWFPPVRVSGKMLLGWKLHLYGYKKKKDMDVECSSCRCTMLKGTGVSFILLCLMAEVSLSAQQVLRIGEYESPSLITANVL